MIVKVSDSLLLSEMGRKMLWQDNNEGNNELGSTEVAFCRRHDCALFARQKWATQLAINVDVYILYQPMTVRLLTDVTALYVSYLT